MKSEDSGFSISKLTIWQAPKERFPGHGCQFAVSATEMAAANLGGGLHRAQATVRALSQAAFDALIKQLLGVVP